MNYQSTTFTRESGVSGIATSDWEEAVNSWLRHGIEMINVRWLALFWRNPRVNGGLPSHRAIQLCGAFLCCQSEYAVEYSRSASDLNAYQSKCMWFKRIYCGCLQRGAKSPRPLRSRHNEGDGDSSHWRLDYLHNRLFRRRSKKTSKLRVTGLCEENLPVTGEFTAQRASNAENASIWWRHHDAATNWQHGNVH